MMEITNYKGIIVIDNFINDQENALFVDLIEKPKCYGVDTYYKYLATETKVTPFNLYIQNGRYYKSAVENNFNPLIDNAYIDIKKRINSLLPLKLKTEHFCIEKYSTTGDYTCESQRPINNDTLGAPASASNNHESFFEYQGEWGLTENGYNLYCARIFLNNDFEGGNVTFPQYKFDINPVRNRLVLYPCNKEYIYGIRKINGSSFHLAFWFVKP